MKNETRLNIYASMQAVSWTITNDDIVVDFGVKHTNVSFDSYNEYMAGNPVSARIVRREKRTARRNNQRTKYRRNVLNYELKKDGFGINRSLSQGQILELVHRASFEKLSKNELGSVLFWFTKKRGYKSQRGVDEVGASEYLAKIKEHAEAMQPFPTLASYLKSLASLKNVIIRREAYIGEFTNICEFQNIDFGKYFRLIFSQRPLKKGAVGFCKLEKNRKVTHKSNPVFEEFRILRDVNNIIIEAKDLTVIDIPLNVKKELYNLLMNGKNVTKALVCRKIGIKNSKNYNWYSGKSIAGNMYATILSEYSSVDIYEFWNDLKSSYDDEHLLHLLKNKYQFDSYVIENVMKLKINSLPYVEFSEKVIKKLIPILQQGKKLKVAILDLYGAVDFGTDIHLRNLVLEQVFYSTKSLVSKIEAKYSIDSMFLELDSFLKMGNKARKNAAKNKRQKIKDIEKTKKIVSEFASPTAYNIKKYLVAEQTDFISPYEPDFKIPLTELFTDKYNLDHILPKSQYFDFSNTNLVISRKDLNLKKNRATAVDFMQGNEKYIEFVENLPAKMKRKKELLLTKKDDIKEAIRDGVDYNTRCFLTLHKNSFNIPNKIIFFLKKQWKLNRYADTDIRYFLEFNFVLANLNLNIIKYFNNIATHSNSTTSRSAYTIEPVIKEFPNFDKVVPFKPKLNLFRKIDKTNFIVRGQLHAESIYSKKQKSEAVNSFGKKTTEYIYSIRKPLADLTQKMVKNIIDNTLRNVVNKRVAKAGSLDAFKMELDKDPVILNENIVKRCKIYVTNAPMYALHDNSEFVYPASYGVDVNGNYINLIEAWKRAKNGKPISDSFIIQRQMIVRFEGKFYQVFGIAKDNVSIRSIYDLKATKGIKLGNKRIPKEIDIVRVNETGDVELLHEKQIEKQENKEIKQFMLF